MGFFDKLRASTTLKAPIFLPAVVFIAAVTLYCSVWPKHAQAVFDVAKLGVFANFSWFYLFAVSLFFLFLVFLCVSSLGDVKLGSDNDAPEFSFWSWSAMLFAAGMGIGLMYFGVAEPVLHYLKPVQTGLSDAERFKEAMLMSSYHWGIHAWSIYAVIGLALAYFGFRYKLPLTIRSGFYPLLKNRISGFWGHAIDVVALCSTIFGLSTTLGFGALQLTAGLHNLGWISGTGPGIQTAITVTLMGLAALSAISGVAKGVRILSETNLYMAFALLVFVTATGPTLLLLSGYTENVGYYFSNLLETSFRTFAYEPEKQGWLSSWTVLYWSWWVSWAPFVGMFIAKISKGRTIREFVLGVLFIPSLFNILWMTVFGGTAIWIDGQSGGALAALQNNTDAMLFRFFEFLPMSDAASVLAMAVISVFFVTSADSGIFVINNIAAQGEDRAAKWQSVFWAVLLVVLTLSLLRSDGLSALQTMTLIIALPFTVIMLMLCFGLWRGLMVDSQYFSKEFTQGSQFWTGQRWKERLAQIIAQPKKNDVHAFIRNTAEPAFEALTAEFTRHGLTAHWQYNEGKYLQIEFVVTNENMRNFLYGIECKPRYLSPLVVEDSNLPHIDTDRVYEPLSYFLDGREGYDVQYMTKEELIADVLKQYERYMNLAMDHAHELMINEMT